MSRSSRQRQSFGLGYIWGGHDTRADTSGTTVRIELHLVFRDFICVSYVRLRNGYVELQIIDSVETSLPTRRTFSLPGNTHIQQWNLLKPDRGARGARRKVSLFRHSAPSLPKVSIFLSSSLPGTSCGIVAYSPPRSRNATKDWMSQLTHVHCGSFCTIGTCLTARSMVSRTSLKGVVAKNLATRIRAESVLLPSGFTALVS